MVRPSIACSLDLKTYTRAPAGIRGCRTAKRDQMAVAIDLAGKKGVVFGVANQRSIAWAISERLLDAGAELAFTYFNDRLLGPVSKTVSGIRRPVFDRVRRYRRSAMSNPSMTKSAEKWGSIDFVVHSIAYAERDDLGGDFSTTGRQGFRTALET